MDKSEKKSWTEQKETKRFAVCKDFDIETAETWKEVIAKSYRDEVTKMLPVVEYNFSPAQNPSEREVRELGEVLEDGYIWIHFTIYGVRPAPFIAHSQLVPIPEKLKPIIRARLNNKNKLLVVEQETPRVVEIEEKQKDLSDMLNRINAAHIASKQAESHDINSNKTNADVINNTPTIRLIKKKPAATHA